MKIIEYPTTEMFDELCKRPVQNSETIQESVTSIFNDVKRNGDDAVNRYTSLFDGVELSSTLVSNEEIDAADELVSLELKNAIQLAKKNIETFHKSQLISASKITTTEGVTCWQKSVGIEKVGLYIPAGTAPLFSSVLMLAIPASIAGCKEIIMVTPPNKKGIIDPAILYAAKICGVTTIAKVGGIQAIAALTFGTESIPNVYKIVGPGNQYVTAAKQMATRFGVAIDMPAGPSELLVIADDSAIPSFVASDLLSQAEHGIDSQVVLVTTSETFAREVVAEVNQQLQQLPRKNIASKAIENSNIILVKTIQDAVYFSNYYSPEHLILATSEDVTAYITNAGSVFIGNYTPESAGDYASGTNHTLPTNGNAKMYSGINMDHFVKKITFQEISAEGIQQLGNTIEVMANAEGLQAHKNAVSIRLAYLNKK